MPGRKVIEARVVRAAMTWHRAGRGYFYRNNEVLHPLLARKLEDACALLTLTRRKREGKRA